MSLNAEASHWTLNQRWRKLLNAEASHWTLKQVTERWRKLLNAEANYWTLKENYAIDRRFRFNFEEKIFEQIDRV
jgi:hypothetical protein